MRIRNAIRAHIPRVDLVLKHMINLIKSSALQLRNVEE